MYMRVEAILYHEYNVAGGVVLMKEQEEQGHCSRLVTGVGRE